MPKHETTGLYGQFQATVRGPGGEVKTSVCGSNVVCTNGKEFLASFLQSAAAAASTFTCRYLAVGTDGTAEAASNTALGTEVARHTATVSYVSNQIYQLTATFTTGVAAGDIAEYGVLSSNTAGTLLSRDTETTIPVGANDTLTVVWQLTIN